MNDYGSFDHTLEDIRQSLRTAESALDNSTRLLMDVTRQHVDSCRERVEQKRTTERYRGVVMQLLTIVFEDDPSRMESHTTDDLLDEVEKLVKEQQP